MTDIAGLVERLREFHAEIVASDGGESEQMVMTREAADALEIVKAERDFFSACHIQTSDQLTAAKAENDRLRDEKATVTRIMNERNETVIRLRAALEAILEANEVSDEIAIDSIARAALTGRGDG